MVEKRQVCFRIEETIVKEMEKLREETGVPISTQIELRLKGYSINKSNPEPRQIIIASNTPLYERWQEFAEKIKVDPQTALIVLLDISEEAERNYASQTDFVKSSIDLMRKGKDARD